MTKRWARLEGTLENGIVFEFVDVDPVGRFHPSLIFVEASKDTVVGSHYAAGVWTPPPPPPEPEIVEGPVEPPPAPAPTYRKLMTPIRFKAQFSVMEQVSIKRARAYVGEDEQAAFARDALDILFGSLDDPRLTEVDVADPSVIGGIDFVASLGILSAERADTIKLGLPA